MFYRLNARRLTTTSMNILAAVNAQYLEPLSVMLYSLSIHNPFPLTVFILHLGISEKEQDDFQRRIGKWKGSIQLQFIQCDCDAIRKDVSYGRYGMEAVLRLMLLSVLPLNIDRILWLDADIIVRGDIQKLYTYRDHGQYAVVCEDMLPRWEKCELVSQLGMKISDRYFNSGVILFYLKNIRAEFSENVFFRWMDENVDKLKYPDQNALNVCLNHKLCWAKPEVYNLQLLRVDHSMCKLGIIKRSKVLHYNTREKPWDDDYNGEGEFEFWKYGIDVLGIKRFITHYVKKVIHRMLDR